MKCIINIIVLFISINIANSQNLSVSLSKHEESCQLAEATITIISKTQPVTILWSNGAISNKIDQLIDGYYSVTIHDGQNQDTTINFEIKNTPCEPIIEKHFTPNGDNYNDTWEISKIEHFPNFELFVYNRWGQLIHTQTNIFIPWDGRSLTLPTPDATYYYILFLDKSNKKNFIKGDVSIIR